jgi:hypothetical protein
MVPPSFSALLRFQPSTLYRFVCGVLGVVATAGFLGCIRDDSTPLHTLAQAYAWFSGGRQWSWPTTAHTWLIARRNFFGPTGASGLVVAVYTARGTMIVGANAETSRSSSSGLLAWAVAVEAGYGGVALWYVGLALGMPTLALWAFKRKVDFDLVGETFAAFLIAYLYCLAPVIWMISAPNPSDEAADFKGGNS